MPTSMITTDLIKERVSEKWEEAGQEYGDKWSVPKEKRFAIGEYERALHVLNVWKNEGQKGNPARMLNAYGVTESVVLEIVAEWCDMQITEEDLSETIKKEKRSDKYDAFIDWSKDKVGQQFTTDALVEVAGFSYITVLKFLADSPNFRKIKKGLWEVRDPRADREAGI